LTGGTPNDPVFAAFTGNGTSTTAIGQGQHSWGTAGFVASPAVAGVVVAANGQYNAATPTNPFSHDSTVAGTTVNNCRAPVLFDIGTAATPKGVQKQ
jgi:hypothetical protein